MAPKNPTKPTRGNTRAPPPKEKGAKSHNWHKWRHAFIDAETPITYEQLATLPDAPSLSLIKKRASAENWQGQREQFWNRVGAKIRETAADQIARAKIRQAQIGQKMQEKAEEALALISAKDLTARDVARLQQVGAHVERNALGMDKPEGNADEQFDQMRDLFIEFLSSEEVGLSAEEAEFTIGRFVAFLSEKRPRT